jgi:hypothetical protein
MTSRRSYCTKVLRVMLILHDPGPVAILIIAGVSARVGRMQLLLVDRQGWLYPTGWILSFRAHLLDAV